MQDHWFADWLKHRRKALDLTQAELASQVGCSAAAIRKMEAQERRPSAQIVERLAQIFRIPPDERTAFLRFARGDWKSAPRESALETPWKISARPPRFNLPAPLTSLIGRDQELARLHGTLLDPAIRLVTLIGPPGIGKTRLSIEGARLLLPDFQDGVFFVALAPLSDPALIVLAIAQTLDYVETKSRPGSQQLIAAIADKQILIVLDNCEHLIDQVASLASELLSGCPRLKILATSREAFRLRGEWLHVVPPLAAPDEGSRDGLYALSQFAALALFAERARAVQAGFELTIDNLPDVSSICARLDGLPLAIELIAARIRLMAPRALLERLDDPFILSANGMRAASARQKTLNDAIRWSYDLLSAEEQRLFACLSVFSGGFTLEAAETTLSGMFEGSFVSDLVAGLSDKSLVQRASAAGGDVRFNMLVTIRQFAVSCLHRMHGEVGIHEAHMHYFIEFARRGNREMHGPRQVEWLDRLENELNNYRAALHWCVDHQRAGEALDLLANLWWVWWLRAYYSEMCSWFETIRVLPGVAEHPAAYSRVLLGMSRHHDLAGNYLQGRRLLDESRAICSNLGVNGQPLLAETLLWLALNAHAGSSDIDAAHAFGDEGLELYRQAEDQWGIAHSLLILGLIAEDRDEHAAALPLFQGCLHIAREMGDLWNVALACRHLGLLFLEQGHFGEARSYLLRHLEHQRKIGFWAGIAIALRNLGDLYRHEGDDEQARRAYDQDLEVCREHNLNVQSELAFLSMGLLALQRDDYAQAARHFVEGCPVAYNIKSSAVDFLLGVAAVAAGMDQPERAATLSGAAQAQLASVGYKPMPLDRATFDRHMRIARENLGAERFEVLAAEGRLMTVEQAIAYALRNSA